MGGRTLTIVVPYPRPALGPNGRPGHWQARARLVREAREDAGWAAKCAVEVATRGVRSYKPDFEVVNLDDSLEYHEVKGYDHPRGVTARKRMAKYHPAVKLVLIDEEQYRAIRKWRALIPGWE